MLSRVLDPCSIVRVQSWDAEPSVPVALDQLVGTVWPRKVGTVVSGPVDVLCIGPAEWLVIGATPGDSELCDRLLIATKGSSLKATDVSEALTAVEIEGPDVREFLLKGCSLDLRADRFLAGQCARTRFAGVPTVLWCRDTSRFEGIVASSHREYLLAWITDSSA